VYGWKRYKPRHGGSSFKDSVDINATIETRGFKLSVVEAFPVTLDVFQNGVLWERIRVCLKPLEPEHIYGVVGFFVDIDVPKTYELSTFLQQVEEAVYTEVGSIVKQGREKQKESQQRKSSEARKSVIREKLHKMLKQG